jgi:hypothetical protein
MAWKFEYIKRVTIRKKKNEQKDEGEEAEEAVTRKEWTGDARLKRETGGSWGWGWGMSSKEKPSLALH